MSNNDNAIIQDKLMYGVWLKGKGWLRGGKDNKVFADLSVVKAQELAKRIGNGAKIYYVDESLIDLELFLIEMEKKNNLLTWLQRLIKKAG